MNGGGGRDIKSKGQKRKKEERTSELFLISDDRGSYSRYLARSIWPNTVTHYSLHAGQVKEKKKGHKMRERKGKKETRYKVGLLLYIDFSLVSWDALSGGYTTTQHTYTRYTETSSGRSGRTRISVTLEYSPHHFRF